MTSTADNNANISMDSRIGAGVKSSWVNALEPGKYYGHEGAAHITLSCNYWPGEASEVKHSGAEIGLRVTSSALGIAGLALTPFTAGASAAAAASAIGGLLVGGAGLALSGISIAWRDFTNEPSKVMGRLLPLDSTSSVSRGVSRRQRNEADTTPPPRRRPPLARRTHRHLVGLLIRASRLLSFT